MALFCFALFGTFLLRSLWQFYYANKKNSKIQLTKNIEIQIPPLEKQYEISKLSTIYIEEKKLTEKLIQLKEKEFQIILEEAINNSNQN